MKLNSTVALTLLLLAMMFGAGFVSAMWGFTVGHQALKGVTQPDVRPTNKLSAKRTAPGKEGLDMLNEEDIIKKVRIYIDSKSKESKNSKKKENDSDSVAEKKSSEEPSPETKAAQNLPIKSQDRQVTLEVRSAVQQGGALLLNVSLKNQGAQAVRFLYSFLNVTDDQGRALSAVTEGLPAEVPPNGEEFVGTVSIPIALLEDAKKLSLTLTDYPEQKLQLKISEIPVIR